jgi:hypothetical protein
MIPFYHGFLQLQKLPNQRSHGGNDSSKIVWFYFALIVMGQSAPGEEKVMLIIGAAPSLLFVKMKVTVHENY